MQPDDETTSTSGSGGQKSRLGTKNPSSRMFWNDLDGDPELNACSLAAQGLWAVHMLPIAARCAARPGYVEVPGKPCDRAHLAESLAGVVGKPAAELEPLIAELVATKTAGIDRRKVLFCRRMVRDHALSLKRSKAGTRGADATHGKKTENEDLPRQPAGNSAGKRTGNTRGNGAGNRSGPSILQSSVLQESYSAAPSPGTASEPVDDRRAAPDLIDEGEKARAGFDVERAGLLACDIAGLDRGRARDDRKVVEAWIARGWNIDTQIEPAIRAAAARTRYVAPQSLNYFTAIIEEFVTAIGHRPVAAGRSTVATAPAPRHGGVSWEKLLSDYRVALDRQDPDSPARRKPFWHAESWGPRPDESGCDAPRELLVKYRFRQADA